MLDMIAGAGGTVQGAQRGLAARAGVSVTRLRQVVAALADEGLVKVRTGTTGTALVLVAH